MPTVIDLPTGFYDSVMYQTVTRFNVGYIRDFVMDTHVVYIPFPLTLLLVWLPVAVMLWRSQHRIGSLLSCNNHGATRLALRSKTYFGADGKGDFEQTATCSSMCSTHVLRQALVNICAGCMCTCVIIVAFYNHNAETCTACMDLRCKNPAVRAYFHRITDCAAPMLATLDAAAESGSCIVAHPFQREIMQALYTTRVTDTGASDMRFAGQLWRCDALVSPPATAQKPAPAPAFARLAHDVIWVSRKGHRELRDEAPLMRALGSLGRVAKYRGDESMDATIRLFASTRALVSYHGAAQANAVFSPNGTCIVEISTYCDLDGNTTWRSNENTVKRAHGGLLRWHVYRLPLASMLFANGLDIHDLERRAAAEVAKGRNSRSQAIDVFIRDFRSYELEQHDVRAITQTLRKCMHEQQHTLTLQQQLRGSKMRRRRLR